jgi:molecular chaperone GrpE
MAPERGKKPGVTTRRPVPPKRAHQADTPSGLAQPPSGATSPTSGEDIPSPTSGEGRPSVPQDQYLRLAADFENFKKRARQEQMDTVQYANSTLVERLLPALDDFRRIVEHSPADVDEGWLRGIQLSLQKLDEVMEAIGVRRIDAEGLPFDPKVHEAIGSVESADHPDDTVLAELRPGYRLHDRVVRPALVRVSRRPAAAAE